MSFDLADGGKQQTRNVGSAPWPLGLSMVCWIGKEWGMMDQGVDGIILVGDRIGRKGEEGAGSAAMRGCGSG